jgi:hypothetical protein
MASEKPKTMQYSARRVRDGTMIDLSLRDHHNPIQGAPPPRTLPIGPLQHGNYTKLITLTLHPHCDPHTAVDLLRRLIDVMDPATK